MDQLNLPRHVPVVSSLGHPLMPCHPARARKLLASNKAIKKFRHGFFYIQLTHRTHGNTQPTAVGVDPGSKMEAFTVKSAHHTYLNIQTEAINGKAISQAVELRAILRRGRRQRNTPYRQCRANRSHSKGWLPPSTKARWQHKLNVIKCLLKLYPISLVAIEDVAAITKPGAKHWNTSFSPVQAGKTWLYNQLKLLGLEVILFKGIDTYNLRQQLCLHKSSDKLSYGFSSHCVDSWVLANAVIGGHYKPELTTVVRLSRITYSRRMLHRANPGTKGLRTRYGGSMALGYKKGTLVQHAKHGKCLIGGNLGDRLSLNSTIQRARLTQNAKLADVVKISYSPWRLIDQPTLASKIENRILRQQKLCSRLRHLGVPNPRIAEQLRLYNPL